MDLSPVTFQGRRATTQHVTGSSLPDSDGGISPGLYIFKSGPANEASMQIRVALEVIWNVPKYLDDTCWSNASETLQCKGNPNQQSGVKTFRWLKVSWQDLADMFFVTCRCSVHLDRTVIGLEVVTRDILT